MTLVTATVRDPAGNPYVNSQIIASFVGQNAVPGAGPYTSGGVPQGQFEIVVPGFTDSFGAMSMPLAGNDTITPTPSQWRFNVVSSTIPPVSFNTLITITGNNQDISAALQAAAASLVTSGGGPVFTIVPFSATPALAGPGVNSKVPVITFQMTLTGNVTAPVLSGIPIGATVILKLIEDAVGGRTFAYPANIKGFTPLITTANTINTQAGVFDGTNLIATGPQQAL